MDNGIFQSIYEKLIPVLPQNWKTIVFRADYTKGSYSMKFYVDFGGGTYIECYNLANISRSALIKAFMDVNAIISTERRKLQDKDLWSVMTVIMGAEGSFRGEFDYRVIDENMISYQDEWEKKYISSISS